jgi:crotonobetainyl-CoA:carnitine CoA-transferase CaiB-like acyl-CoA transferase
MPFGSFDNFEEVTASPQFKARGFFVDIDHPRTGSLQYPGMPFKMGDLASSIERAPLLGEHNEEIYCKRLGYSQADLVLLSQTGII